MTSKVFNALTGISRISRAERGRGVREILCQKGKEMPGKSGLRRGVQKQMGKRLRGQTTCCFRFVQGIGVTANLQQQAACG